MSSEFMQHDELTKEQAIALFDSGWWKDKPAREVVNVQLFTTKLIMDFGDFHGAVEEALGRPVWTHEFAHPESLQKEFLGLKPAPTWEEIVNLIPEEKRIIVHI